MKVVFFNHFHNGDVHVSRGFVRQIMKKLPEVSFSYAHRNAPSILQDIPNLNFEPAALSQIGNEHTGVQRTGDTVYINTWYGQQRFKYMNRYGVTMDSVYAALNDSCQDIWGFSLEDVSSDPKEFFPTIDYSTYHIQKSQKWLSENPNKKIFIANGIALSGQAHNFDLTAIINRVAVRHPTTIFIMSNTESRVIAPNIIYSSNIIHKNGSDLNENAFLSEHCDVVIGRASGVFTFALTQENMLKRQSKFLCFSNLVPKQSGKFWLDELLSDKINYSSNIITTNESNVHNIERIIEEQL